MNIEQGMSNDELDETSGERMSTHLRFPNAKVGMLLRPEAAMRHIQFFTQGLAGVNIKKSELLATTVVDGSTGDVRQKTKYGSLGDRRIPLIFSAPF
jgi:hypothetical protein